MRNFDSIHLSKAHLRLIIINIFKPYKLSLVWHEVYVFNIFCDASFIKIY